MGTLIAANLVFAILLLAYMFLVSKSGKFRLNRWLLLSLPFVSFGIALIDVPAASSDAVMRVTLQEATVTVTQAVQEVSVSWWSTAYGVGIGISLLLFFVGLWKIRQHRSTSKTAIDGIQVYDLGDGSSFSFFRNVFISSEDAGNDSVLKHELAHAKQGHTWDILFGRLFMALNWFNPMVYFYVKAIQENHEYLADAAVTAQADKQAYAQLIVNSAFGADVFPLANGFNGKSMISKRIDMLINNQPKYSLMKYLLILPLFAGLLYVSSCSQATDNMPIPNDRMASYPGGQEAMFKFIGEHVEYPQNLKEEGKTGKAYINFTVGTDGTLSGFKVLKTDAEEFGTSAIETLKQMPKWEPSIKDGKAVSVDFTLPIAYTI